MGVAGFYPWGTMPKRSSTGRLDLNQLAKRIINKATGETPPCEPEPDKNKAAQELERLGGLKGGAARAKKLTAEERSEIVKKAADARWEASRPQTEDQKNPPSSS